MSPEVNVTSPLLDADSIGHGNWDPFRTKEHKIEEALSIVCLVEKLIAQDLQIMLLYERVFHIPPGVFFFFYRFMKLHTENQ